MKKRVRVTIHTEVEVTLDNLPTPFTDDDARRLAEMSVLESVASEKISWDLRSQILEEC